MSGEPSTTNPKKAFIKEKHEKMLALKKEVKMLRKDLTKLRANAADTTTKKAAHASISAKRSEFKTLRKSHFTPV